MNVSRNEQPTGRLIVGEISRQKSDAGNHSWLHAEASIWTRPMLAALVNGVKGNKWFSLMDKVYAKSTLQIAWGKVRANKGVAGIDRISIERFEANADNYLEEVHYQLKSHSYRPNGIRRVMIPKGDGKERPLGIPTVMDRIVQMAIKLVIEPIFEQEFNRCSYGFRPGKGCKDALRAVDVRLKSGKRWVVDADIQGYFDNINHQKLMAKLETRIADTSLLELIRDYLEQEIITGMEQWTPTKGTPQGAVLSPLLANIYLNELDYQIGKYHQVVRYADDFVILCDDEQEARRALERVSAWMEVHDLTLHPEKTHIVDEAVSESGFDFLGYTFKQGKRSVRAKSLKSMRDKIRGCTRRSQGVGLVEIIKRLNPILRGWFEYFKHAESRIFSTIDGFVRRRLRSILRRYNKQGRGTGRCHNDHRRWPNIFFAEQGLFTLQGAYEKASESRC